MMTESSFVHTQEHWRGPLPSYLPTRMHGRWRTTSHGHGQTPSPRMSLYSDSIDHRELTMNRGGGNLLVDSSNDGGGGRDLDLDLVQHYCTAYSAAELKTFHCERVRKLPLSGLDPSVLIGLLCQDEAEVGFQEEG